MMISPDPQDRSVVVAGIPTRHLYNQVLGRLGQNRCEAAIQLYQLFSKHPKTMASAGYALDDAIHDLLSRGGSWELVQLSKGRPGPVNTHWKTPHSSTDGFHLFLGGKGEIVVISSEPKPDTNTSAPQQLKMIPFRNNLQTLEDGYYCPEVSNQDTIDAFIYEATSRRATLFQSTASSNPHSFKGKVVKWLKGLGVQTFLYIAVTPPEINVDIAVPNDFREEICNCYQLTLTLDLDSRHPGHAA
jgi:hypothetical protein